MSARGKERWRRGRRSAQSERELADAFVLYYIHKVFPPRIFEEFSRELTGKRKEFWIPILEKNERTYESFLSYVMNKLEEYSPVIKMANEIVLKHLIRHSSKEIVIAFEEATGDQVLPNLKSLLSSPLIPPEEETSSFSDVICLSGSSDDDSASSQSQNVFNTSSNVPSLSTKKGSPVIIDISDDMDEETPLTKQKTYFSHKKRDESTSSENNLFSPETSASIHSFMSYSHDEGTPKSHLKYDRGGTSSDKKSHGISYLVNNSSESFDSETEERKLEEDSISSLEKPSVVEEMSCASPITNNRSSSMISQALDSFNKESLRKKSFQKDCSITLPTDVSSFGFSNSSVTQKDLSDSFDSTSEDEPLTMQKASKFPKIFCYTKTISKTTASPPSSFDYAQCLNPNNVRIPYEVIPVKCSGISSTDGIRFEQSEQYLSTHTAKSSENKSISSDSLSKVDNNTLKSPPSISKNICLKKADGFKSQSNRWSIYDDQLLIELMVNEFPTTILNILLKCKFFIKWENILRRSHKAILSRWLYKIRPFIVLYFEKSDILSWELKMFDFLKKKNYPDKSAILWSEVAKVLPIERLSLLRKTLETVQDNRDMSLSEAIEAGLMRFSSSKYRYQKLKIFYENLLDKMPLKSAIISSSPDNPTSSAEIFSLKTDHFHEWTPCMDIELTYIVFKMNESFSSLSRENLSQICPPLKSFMSNFEIGQASVKEHWKNELCPRILSKITERNSVAKFVHGLVYNRIVHAEDIDWDWAIPLFPNRYFAFDIRKSLSKTLLSDFIRRSIKSLVEKKDTEVSEMPDSLLKVWPIKYDNKFIETVIKDNSVELVVDLNEETVRRLCITLNKDHKEILSHWETRIYPLMFKNDRIVKEMGSENLARLFEELTKDPNVLKCTNFDGISLHPIKSLDNNELYILRNYITYKKQNLCRLYEVVESEFTYEESKIILDFVFAHRSYIDIISRCIMPDFFKKLKVRDKSYLTLYLHYEKIIVMFFHLNKKRIWKIDFLKYVLKQKVLYYSMLNTEDIQTFFSEVSTDDVKYFFTSISMFSKSSDTEEFLSNIKRLLNLFTVKSSDFIKYKDIMTYLKSLQDLQKNNKRCKWIPSESLRLIKTIAEHFPEADLSVLNPTIDFFETISDEIGKHKFLLRNHWTNKIRPLLISYSKGDINESWKYKVISYLINKEVIREELIDWTDIKAEFPHIRSSMIRSLVQNVQKQDSNKEGDIGFQDMLKRNAESYKYSDVASLNRRFLPVIQCYRDHLRRRKESDDLRNNMNFNEPIPIADGYGALKSELMPNLFDFDKILDYILNLNILVPAINVFVKASIVPKDKRIFISKGVKFGRLTKTERMILTKNWKTLISTVNIKSMDSVIKEILNLKSTDLIKRNVFALYLGQNFPDTRLASEIFLKWKYLFANQSF